VVAVAAPVAAVVATAVAAAATKRSQRYSDVSLTTKRSFGTFLRCARNWAEAALRCQQSGGMVRRGHCCEWRGLRGRPASNLSNSQLGSSRSNLATTPICQGITR